MYKIFLIFLILVIFSLMNNHFKYQSGVVTRLVNTDAPHIALLNSAPFLAVHLPHLTCRYIPWVASCATPANPPTHLQASFLYAPLIPFPCQFPSATA